MQQRNSELPNETREYNEPWPDPNIPYNPEKIIADAEKHVKEKREAYLSSCLLNSSYIALQMVFEYNIQGVCWIGLQEYTNVLWNHNNAIILAADSAVTVGGYAAIHDL